MGVLKVAEFKSTVAHSFLDFLAGGVDMSLMVAVDFTGSNGHPLHPQSLHYLSPQGSQYQQAIRTIGNIVSCYDSDQNFPVWGFVKWKKKKRSFLKKKKKKKSGLSLTPPFFFFLKKKKIYGKVSHDFALNGNELNPEVHGIYGIEQMYISAIKQVELYGPTLFQPILSKAIAIASAAHSN
ncbi:copine, partial [Reticulomyxa filosa]